MRILYFKWNSFGANDIQEAFENLGHEIITIPWDQDAVYRDDKLQNEIKTRLLEERIETAFSSDYYPPIAVACHETGIPYISWIYDSPYITLYSYTALYETNHIYIFDREQYTELANNGIKTVHYMPLAANPQRLRTMVEDNEQQNLFINSDFYNRSDIAFVGAMYDEENTFYRKLEGISDHTRGYLEGLISAQEQIWGYNFVRGLLRKEILDDIERVYPLRFSEDCVVQRDYVYAEYCINREITARERLRYITETAKRFSQNDHAAIDLYTMNEELKIPGVCNHGFVGPEKIAPFIYDKAKINLNITLRSIHSGIPLRAFEIMGSGGFLLSNYQDDYIDCYIDGEDYVSFESEEDMINKIEYYLAHDDERKEIAANGLKKTAEEHTYENRLRMMLDGMDYASVSR